MNKVRLNWRTYLSYLIQFIFVMIGLVGATFLIFLITDSTGLINRSKIFNIYNSNFWLKFIVDFVPIYITVSSLNQIIVFYEVDFKVLDIKILYRLFRSGFIVGTLSTVAQAAIEMLITYLN